MSTNTVHALGEPELRRILVDEIGIDSDLLDSAPGTVLADLGMDSMAQVELGVLLRKRFGIEELPEDANAMSVGELAGHLRETAA